MATVDEICEKAAKSEPFRGTTIELALYHGLNALYRMYAAGLIPAQYAGQQKAILLKQYRHDAIVERAMMADARRRLEIGKFAQTVDFNLCPLIRLFDGRDSEAETAKGGVHK